MSDDLSPSPDRRPLGGPAPQTRPALDVAFVPGVMPGRWFSRWQDRHPRHPLHERPLDDEVVPAGLPGLLETDGVPAVCFLRLPADPAAQQRWSEEIRREHHAVTVYEEQQVVVFPVEHDLEYEEGEVRWAELVGFPPVQDLSAHPDWAAARAEAGLPPTAPVPEHSTVAEAVELCAAGLGVLVLPLSLARLHHRKDLKHRPLAEAGTQPVLLVWPQHLPEEQEELVQDFVGLVRGRSAASSRNAVVATESRGTKGTPARGRGSTGKKASGGTGGQRRGGTKKTAGARGAGTRRSGRGR